MPVYAARWRMRYVVTGQTRPTVAAVGRYVARGYTAVRAQCAVPGVATHSAETDRVFPHAYTFADGMMHPGEAPGLGVDMDEALAATYP